MADITADFLFQGALTNDGGGTFTVNTPNTGQGPVTVTFNDSITVGSSFTWFDHNGAAHPGVYVGTNANGDLIYQDGGSFQFLTNTLYANGATIPSTPTDFVCFLAGTRIATPDGERLVETLQVGDVVLTASGEVRPVKWMGHRDLDLRRNPDPRRYFPVRIAQDAFGPNRPSQDLYLSSGHSVCVDLIGEVFIPVGNLVNGATIVQIEMDEVTYWHVELDSHDILIANNLPAESYLAMGNRSFFEERRGLLPAMLEGRDRTHADFCRPVVLDGPVLSFVRQRLMERATASGWTPCRDAELRLVVDGEVHHPVEEGGASVFRFPVSTRDARLLCKTFVPALVGYGGDSRELGVMLSGLSFSGDECEHRTVPLDDERLRDGIHQLEDHHGNARRWTNAKLVLDPQFWEGWTGQVALRVTYDVTTVRGWTAPGDGAKEAAPVGRPKHQAVG